MNRRGLYLGHFNEYDVGIKKLKVQHEALTFWQDQLQFREANCPVNTHQAKKDTRADSEVSLSI